MAEQAHRAGLGVALDMDGSVHADRVVIAGVSRSAVAGQGVEVVRKLRSRDEVLVCLSEGGGGGKELLLVGGVNSPLST